MRVLTKLGVIAGMVALASCGGSGYTAPKNNNGGGGGTNNPNGIDVLDNHFSPDSIAVAKGATVTWTWGGYAIHNVTFTDRTIGDSDDQSMGTFTKPFATAGVYEFHCTHHAGMTGKIVVQ